MEKIDKEKIKKSMKDLVDISKNLHDPKNDEEQKQLDDIMDQVNILSNYIDGLKNNKN